MSELENLRPEARRIAGLFDDSLKTRSVFSDGWQIIRTELLRLAGAESELAALKARIAEADCVTPFTSQAGTLIHCSDLLRGKRVRLVVEEW